MKDKTIRSVLNHIRFFGTLAIFPIILLTYEEPNPTINLPPIENSQSILREEFRQQRQSRIEKRTKDFLEKYDLNGDDFFDMGELQRYVQIRPY